MIRYTSDRKYANVIKDLNRKYNERFFNLNNRNVAGYDVANKVWFFDENIVDYNDYLRYARFTPEQLKYLRHFSTNLTNLFQEIDSKIDFQNFNTRYKFEGDVYSVYKSDTTTIIYLTDSVKGTEKLRVVYYKPFQENLENKRIIVVGNLSIYKGHGEIQLIAENIHSTNKKTKYQQQIDTWYNDIYKMGIFLKHVKYTFSDVQHIGIISNDKKGKGYDDFKSILEKTRYTIEEKFTTLTAENIAKEIQNFSKIKSVDCICIIRGGGNKYDLLDFNNPLLIKAMYDSGLFIFTAIGHTSDNLICNKFADYNASTPTALATYLKNLQYAEINKQKEKKLLLLSLLLLLNNNNDNNNLINENNDLKNKNQYLDLENKRLKRKINDLIDENENLNEQLKKSKKGFFSKLFG